MYIQHTMKVLTMTATLAALCAVAACMPSYRRHPATGSSISAPWDSGPLDRDYSRERADLVARHNRELANPEHGESKYDMDKRQANENEALEVRYRRGKETHANALPPA